MLHPGDVKTSTFGSPAPGGLLDGEVVPGSVVVEPPPQPVAADAAIATRTNAAIAYLKARVRSVRTSLTSFQPVLPPPYVFEDEELLIRGKLR